MTSNSRIISISEPPVWRPIRRPELGPLDMVSELVETLEKRNPGLLTSVRLGPTLGLFCDYSGQHHPASHEAYSFLLADLAYCWRWDDDRQCVRRKFLRDSRRMSFKGLSDERRRRALLPFLRATESIPGLLFTVVIEKSLKKTVFDFRAEEGHESAIKLDHWHKFALQRFLLMGHIGSLLLSGLSAPMQNVFWFTDQDDLAANDSRVIEGTRALGALTSNYLSHDLGHLRYGTTRCDPGDRFIEDLTSLPDLAAGALNEIANSAPIYHVHAPLPKSLSIKTRNIAGWLSENTHTLKKLTFIIDNGELGKVRVRGLSLMPEYSSLYI